MKKQKFSVGDRIAFTIYAGRYKGKVTEVNDNFMVVYCAKRKAMYSLWFAHQDYESYKIKRLVKKKKHVEPASIKLFEGCYGKDRTGKVHGPMRTIKLEHNCTPYKFEVDNFAWTRDGISYPSAGPMPSDIIELVEAPKPVEKRAAREWYIRPRDDTDFVIDCCPKIVQPSKEHGYILVREILDEQGEK